MKDELIINEWLEKLQKRGKLNNFKPKCLKSGFVHRINSNLAVKFNIVKMLNNDLKYRMI